MTKIIKTEDEYRAALARYCKVLSEPKGTPLGDERELLQVLLAHYEDKQIKAEPMPHPIKAIKFRMNQLDYKPKHLAEILGLKSRASEILSGKRKLTLVMIRKLHKCLDIPVDVLIQKY